MIDFMIMNIEGTKIVKKYMTKVEPGSDLSKHIHICYSVFEKYCQIRRLTTLSDL